MIEHHPALSVGDVAADVEQELLRFLYLLHWVTTDQLCRLLWNHPLTPVLRKWLDPPLHRLGDLDLIWRTPRRAAPGYRTQRSGYASGGWYYGLTERGRTRTRMLLPELAAVHCVTREGYLNEAERRALAHSSHVTEWCVLLVQHLRASPYLAGLFLELESMVMGSHLRMDALIRVRLWQQPHVITPGNERPPWWVPWLPSLQTSPWPDAVDVTFALENDEGTEALDVLERKGCNYARTYMGGQLLLDAAGHSNLPPVAWPDVLCPVGTPAQLDVQRSWFPIPVFVMTNRPRLAHVWEAYHRGWSGSEVRMTTWEHIYQAPSVTRTPYLNHEREWVDLLGHPLNGAQR